MSTEVGNFGREESKMTVKVESTWGSHEGFRLTMPNGDRETLRGFRWTRKLATQALDLLEHVYGFQRSSVRFDVR
jgi:hypothetical protein